MCGGWVYRLPWVSVLRCVVASLPPSMATAAAHNKVTVESVLAAFQAQPAVLDRSGGPPPVSRRAHQGQNHGARSFVGSHAGEGFQSFGFPILLISEWATQRTIGHHGFHSGLFGPIFKNIGFFRFQKKT